MFSGPILDPSTLLGRSAAMVVIDARAGGGAAAAYRARHVTGAIHADLERDLSAPADPRAGGRHPLPPLDAWCTQVGEWGIDSSTPVAIYDAQAGAMAAARAWWMLRAIGHEHVGVIDGGLSALEAVGVELDEVPVVPQRKAAYPSQVPAWPTVDAAFVAQAVEDSTWSIVDARAPERYRGESEPIDPIAGHIPSASNLYWKSQVDDAGRFVPEDVRRHAYRKVRADTNDNGVICYCGSGVTACHLLLGLEAAGIQGAQLYVGSWSEWCRLHPG